MTRFSQFMKTAALGMALGALASQTAKAQFDPGTAILVNNTNRQNAEAANSSGSCSAGCQAIVDDYYKRQAAQATNKSPPKPAPVNPYVKQAQVIFATDANGNYKNPHVGEIVNNTIKLYNQAAANGLALTPGLYVPMKQYFNGLKNPQDQDIAVVAFLPSLMKASGYPDGMTIVDEYADYKEKTASKGQASIVDHFNKDVLLRNPSGVPGSEAQRIAISSLTGVPYPPRPVLALNGHKPAGQ
jgi:hypothetical protein